MELRSILEALDQVARNDFRDVLIRDHADRNVVSRA